MEARGLVNIYDCDVCGGQTVTITGTDGTTPFMTKCRANWPGDPCSGFAQSRFYRVSPGEIPEWEWYRPEGDELEQLEKETPGMKDYVERGCLVLRRLDPIRREELTGHKTRRA